MEINKELEQRRRALAGEFTTFSGIGKNAFTSFFGEGDSSWTQAQKDLAVINSANKILADNLKTANRVKVEVELTGDGADKARVTNVTGTGETAPRVNKGKTGKQ